jgi:hypothetical protein
MRFPPGGSGVALMDAVVSPEADISPGGSSGEDAGAPDPLVSCANPTVAEIRINTNALIAPVREMRLAKIVTSLKLFFTFGPANTVTLDC